MKHSEVNLNNTYLILTASVYSKYYSDSAVATAKLEMNANKLSAKAIVGRNKTLYYCIIVLIINKHSMSFQSPVACACRGRLRFKHGQHFTYHLNSRTLAE